MQKETGATAQALRYNIIRNSCPFPIKNFELQGNFSPFTCIYISMKTYYWCISLVLACLGGNRLPAQELSGTWVGNYAKHIMMTNPQKLVVELFLHEDSILSGASHLYYRNNMYEHYTLVGRYNKKDSTAYFREDSTLGVKLGFMGSNCLGNYAVKLVVTDSSMQLTGKWSDNSRSLFHCPTVKVFLEKPLPHATVNKAKPRIVAQPIAKVEEKAPVITKPVVKAPVAEKAVIKEHVADRNLQRASEIQSLIELSAAEKDSIKVEIYDNKDVDGDIISLYFNDNTVLSKQMLTATPLVLYLSLNKDEPMNKIKMAAESMGSDPPCTALMRITTNKGKKYEINLSSNYSKNSIVELFLKE